MVKKVQVGKDQEKAQSERDPHPKNRGGKKPNQQPGTHTTKHIVSRTSSHPPNRRPPSYPNLTKNTKSLCMTLVYSPGITCMQGLVVPQSFRLVSSWIPFRSQRFARSLPKVTLAFAILAVTSSSMCTTLERVLPKH